MLAAVKAKPPLGAPAAALTAAVRGAESLTRATATECSAGGSGSRVGTIAPQAARLPLVAILGSSFRFADRTHFIESWRINFN